MEKHFIFDNGIVLSGTSDTDVEHIPWNPHPSFRGVSMKNLVCGSDTSGRLSCHLVRIEPGCEIGTHMHEGRIEIHEVVSGRGSCIVGDRELKYNTGVVSCIPDNIYHRIVAGEDGLCLMAKFSPALI